MLDKQEIISSSLPIKEDIISGIYFLIKEEIIYIGSAYNVHLRLRDHRKNKRRLYTHVKIITTSVNMLPTKEDSESRYALERSYIEKFCPIYNFQWNPEVDNGNRELVRTFLNHFSSADEVAALAGVSQPTVYNVVFKRKPVKIDKRRRVENTILSRSTSRKYKEMYLKTRLITEGF